MLASPRQDHEFGRAVLLTVGLWLTVWGFWAAGRLVTHPAGFMREAPLDLVVTLVKAAVATALYPLCLRTRGWTVPRRWAAISASVLGLALLQSLLELGQVILLGQWPGLSPAHWPAVRARFGASLFNHAYLSFSTAALLAFQVEVRCSGEQRLRLARAEAAAERAQMAALRFQLNPHFLFNTLNAISGLVVTRRSDDAEEMLLRLSDFLRNSLATEPDQMVTLSDEAEMIETYLQIEQVRFGERLRIAIDYPRALGDALVPSFILQPLVENAVKYGVARASGEVTVAVAAAAHDDAIELTVRDDGDAAPPDKAIPGLGVGLANIRQRLDALFGGRARMSAGKEEAWYVVRLRLPLRRAPT